MVTSVASSVTAVVTSAATAGQGLGADEGDGESQEEDEGEEPHLKGASREKDPEELGLFGKHFLFLIN